MKNSLIPEQTCRKCGCTDTDCSGCIERTGSPCHWVEENLCSACIDDPEPAEDIIDKPQARKVTVGRGKKMKEFNTRAVNPSSYHCKK